MIDHSRIYLASTLGNDPHTEGLHISSKIAKLAGIRSIILEPSESYDRLFLSIKEHRPD